MKNKKNPFFELMKKTTIDYYLPKDNLKMIEGLKDDVKEFFDKTCPDDLNGSFFDKKINKVFLLAKKEGDKQNIEHLMVISGMKQDIQIAITELEKDIAKLNVMIEECREELGKL